MSYALPSPPAPQAPPPPPGGAELKATFIKLGQILSMRPDLLGPELIAELAKLREAVPTEPANEEAV